MNILAFESTCDETAAAVVRDGRTILSDAIASQVDMHALYGGVVPEIASRKHVEAIVGLADRALSDAGLTRAGIDAIAVSYAPGLIGAVLVGVNFAKSAALALEVPLIPVHHIRGHIAANYLAHPDLEPPFVCLCVSGGNTLIADVRDYTDMEVMGATRDDAAGECFDKAARVLGIGYPGGGPMDRLARGGERQALPAAPLLRGGPSPGHVLLRAENGGTQPGPQRPAEGGGTGLPRSGRLFFRRRQRHPGAPGHGGRPSEGLRQGGRGGGRGGQFPHPGRPGKACRKSGDKLFLPPLSLCGDNGAMIGSQGYYEYLAGRRAGSDLNAYATRDLGLG